MLNLDFLENSCRSRSRKPKIAVIGPLSSQGRAIQQQVGDVAILTILDKDHDVSYSRMSGYDYIIISRHASHNHVASAHNAVGRDRVHRLLTGGIGRIVQVIHALVAAELAAV